LLNRNLARAAYVVGFALILIPMFDAGTSVLPLRFAESRWRYGTLGLLSNSLLIPLAGVLVIFAVANAYGHRRMLRVLGAIAGISTLLCFAAMITFSLDALQSQGGIAPAYHAAYLVASSTALVKLLIGGIAFAFFALAGLKRLVGESAKPGKRDQILVGNLVEAKRVKETAGA
jgi:hypothetical protein